MATLRVEDLTKSYRTPFNRIPTPVLRGISLVVPRGTVFGFMGPNGAGKTTFIKALLGILTPDSGTIEVMGLAPGAPQSRQSVGYLPEKIHFAPGTTAESFLMSTGRLKRIPNVHDDVKKQLARVGLAANTTQKVSAFSKGMKQRLGMAAALLGQPELLVLDEPTDGIDPLGRATIRAIIAEENHRGATIFLNSHLLSETEKICQRVGILVDGHLKREGPIEEIRRVEHAWTLQFAMPASSEKLTSIGFSPTGDESVWRFRGSDVDSLNQAIAQARQAGINLLELRAHERDLEAVLADLVGEQL